MPHIFMYSIQTRRGGLIKVTFYGLKSDICTVHKSADYSSFITTGCRLYCLVKAALFGAHLESIASTNVLQLLGDFRRSSVQLLGHTLLFVRVHAVELLAQISIDHILYREIVGSKAEVISATKWREL